jgi:membrane-associated phospholipid phosphatase
MPSGHTQSIFYSTSFIFLAFNKTSYLLFFILISLITMSQRIILNHHTYLQVLVGGIVGFIMANIFFFISQQKLKGDIREKPDDNEE